MKLHLLSTTATCLMFSPQRGAHAQLGNGECIIFEAVMMCSGPRHAETTGQIQLYRLSRDTKQARRPYILLHRAERRVYGGMIKAARGRQMQCRLVHQPK